MEPSNVAFWLYLKIFVISHVFQVPWLELIRNQLEKFRILQITKFLNEVIRCTYDDWRKTYIFLNLIFLFDSILTLILRYPNFFAAPFDLELSIESIELME